MRLSQFWAEPIIDKQLKMEALRNHLAIQASWQDQQNGMCAQRRLRSAWVSAQSDQSLRCPHEEALGPWLPIKRTAKTLIRLGGCPGWSQSLLGAHAILLVLLAILLVLSWGGSNIIFLTCGSSKTQTWYCSRRSQCSWGMSWENLSSGVSVQVRLKPVCSATEVS